MQTLTVKFYYDADGNILSHPQAQRNARVLETMGWEEEPERRLVQVTVRELPNGKTYDVTRDWPNAVKRFFKWIQKEAG